jgi:phosphatidylinositol-3-phosphatase
MQPAIDGRGRQPDTVSYGRAVTKPRILVSILALAVAGGCSSGSSEGTSSAPTMSTTSTSTNALGRTPPPRVCGKAKPHHKRYKSVVVFAFENRTWEGVGGAGFGSMPFLHARARQCAYFADWTETDTRQNSLTQYVGQVTGARQPGTINDCLPSATCSTRADNIFRQARRAGLVAINYVEGPSTGCSAEGNAAKHIPALYLWGADDRDHCNEQVRPLRELNVDDLPDFAFVTPNLCNDGHDCPNATVDTWARDHIQPVTDSADYRAGKVAVFVWYDEDRPVPNLWITPTATPGVHVLAGAGFAGTLAAWESMLGLPCLANACAAVDMRTATNS